MLKGTARRLTVLDVDVKRHERGLLRRVSEAYSHERSTGWMTHKSSNSRFEQSPHIVLVPAGHPLHCRWPGQWRSSSVIALRYWMRQRTRRRGF